MQNIDWMAIMVPGKCFLYGSRLCSEADIVKMAQHVWDVAQSGENTIVWVQPGDVDPDLFLCDSPWVGFAAAVDGGVPVMNEHVYDEIKTSIVATSTAQIVGALKARFAEVESTFKRMDDWEDRDVSQYGEGPTETVFGKPEDEEVRSANAQAVA